MHRFEVDVAIFRPRRGSFHDADKWLLGGGTQRNAVCGQLGKAGPGVAIAVTRFRIAARGVAFVPLCFCRLLCGRHRAQFLRYRFTLALLDSPPDAERPGRLISGGPALEDPS